MTESTVSGDRVRAPSGAPRRAMVQRLSGVSLGVPSPTATGSFLERVLEFHRSSEPGAEHLTAEGEYGRPAPRRLLTLVEAAELAVEEVRFDADRERLEELARRLPWAEVEYEGDADRGFVFRDLYGVRVACGPPETLNDTIPASQVRPRRLGHVNLKVPSASSAAAFYESVLGLRVSEEIGELLVFLRVGTDHHNLGLRSGAETANIHHIAFEVPGWESMRVICDHVAGCGATVEYGPGRHGPGHNLFVYLTEPSSGLRIELFADMAHIDDDDFEPIRWESMDRAKTVNVWGPGPPESFLR